MKQEEESQLVLKRLDTLNFGTIKSSDALKNEKDTDTTTLNYVNEINLAQLGTRITQLKSILLYCKTNYACGIITIFLLIALIIALLFLLPKVYQQECETEGKP